LLTVKTYTKEEALLKRVKQLELELFNSKKEIVKLSAYNQQLESLVKGANSTNQSKTITIKSATRVEFVEVEDIVCCYADMGYTDIHLRNGKIITATKSILKFEELLSSFSFFRISKSHLINLSLVKTFHKDKNEILLEGDILLKVARRRRVDFLKTLA